MPPRTRSRLAGPAGALRVHTAAERLTADGAGLSIYRPATMRMVDEGEGLLVTQPAALTAAADGDRDPDPWQEQRLQAAADLERWERKLEAAAGRALSAWTAVCASAVLEDRYLTAAPDTGGTLPPDPNAIPPLRSVWQQIAGTHIIKVIGDLLGEVFARFLRGDEVVSARPWQEQYLEDVSNRLVSVADSTFDAIRGVVQDGIDEGASIPTIRDRVQEALDTGGETSWAHRAQTIARTETIGAYNGGHQAVWEVIEEETGESVEKAWLATIDPRTRDSHFRADGQRVPLGEQFRVGGHSLAFPGDPTGPASEVINCRCTMLLLEPDEPTPDTTDRGFRDAGEVAAEIARRAEQDPPVVRFYADPAASLQAAAGQRAPRGLLRDALDQPQARYGADGRALPLPGNDQPARPPAGLVARADAAFIASYTDDDPLLADDTAVVDPALVTAILEGALVAAGLGGLAKGNFFDPNQKRDNHGRWTRHGSAISISIKGGGEERASFAEPSPELARVTWEHDDLVGSDGKTYRSRVTESFWAGGDDYAVAITFEDEEGRFVGSASREITPTPDGPAIMHDSLAIKKEFQGLGIASEFNRRAEEVYRAAGATHITTYAVSKPATGYVGGYVWARRGFGWADAVGPAKVAKALRELSPMGKSPEVDALVARMADPEVADLPGLPTPLEISEFRLPGNAPGHGIGKAALLRTSWEGVRWLPADEPEPEPTKPSAGAPSVKVLTWEDDSSGTDWQRSADPQVRAANLWAQTYEGMTALRQAMRNLAAGADDPLAGIQAVDAKGNVRDPFDPEGRLYLMTEAIDRNSNEPLSRRPITYGVPELRAEVLAGAHTLRALLADAAPTDQPLYRAMRVDDPDALFTPGGVIDLDASSATPHRHIADMYLSEDRWRKGAEPVLLTIAPGVTAANLDDGRMMGGFRGSDEHLVTGRLTVTSVHRKDGVVHVEVGPAPVEDPGTPDGSPRELTEPPREFRTLARPEDGDAFLREHFDPKALTKAEKEAVGYWTSGTNYRQVNELLRTGSLDVKVMTDRGEFRPADGGGLERIRPAVYETRTVRSSADLRAVAADADGGARGSGASLARLADQLDNLPAAIGKHQTPEDMSLFRVASMPELAGADPAALVGRTLTDRGYVATSTSEKSAVLVTSEALGVTGPGTVLFEIRTPAGTPFATPELKMGTVNGTPLGGYTRVQELLLEPSSFRVLEVRDDEVDTSGYSLKKGALVTADPKAKRPATAVRRIVVELVDPDEAPPAPATAPDAPAADAPAADAPTPPPIRLTAARVTALEYYSVPVGDRAGRAPNYSVYMPLLSAGLIERDDAGKYVATDAGRAALADAPAPDSPSLPADRPADVPPLTGADAYAAVPRLPANASLDMRLAVADYQGAGFSPLNQGLRSGGEMDRAQNKLRDRLDDAFAATDPLEQPITVYRGSGSASLIFGDTPLEPGAVISDRGYLSTSTDPAVAGKFIQLSSDPAILEITVPAGTRAIAVMGDEGYESEALLPRDTQLRVVSDGTRRTVTNQAGYDQLAGTAKRGKWPEGELDRVARKSGLVVDARYITAELVPSPTEDQRDATPDVPAEAPAAASRPAAAPDSPGDSADATPAAAAALADADAKAAAKAEKKRAAAERKAAKAAKDAEAARAADLASQTDSGGVPLKLTYDYLSGLNDDELEDVEVHLIEGVAAGDPLSESRLEDLSAFTGAQRAQDRIASEGDDDVSITRAIDSWLEANGRPGLTHPAVGGSGASGDVLGIPTMKEVRAEYQEFLHQQYLAAEDATRGHMLNQAGRRRMEKGSIDHFSMFSSPRGVADVMQYASDELLEWFETNRRISWAEFYFDRTGAPGYAEKAAKARGISVAIDRDRNALEHIKVSKKSYRASLRRGLTAAARTAPAEPVEPSTEQLTAYTAGRAAHADGQPLTACPHSPTGRDPEGLFVLWVRGYVAGKRAAATAARVAEGLLPDPALDRLGWTGGDALVLEPPAAADAGDRLLALDGELLLGVGPALTASPAPSGQTVTAAGSGPGDASAIEGRHPMPRTWSSAPHLAPFGVPTGDGRIFKVGSLTARELPLPLLFQPTSGFGHDGSVVVGRILRVEFTETGIVASGDYLDADAASAPDLSKAIEQAVALTEAGLGHVSVDLSDVVGELVDEDGNPVDMEELFDAWDKGENPTVLEQVSEGKLIACTQVATPAFEGAKIELSAGAPADVDGEASLEDADGAPIEVGAIVDVDQGDDAPLRARVTDVTEAVVSDEDDVEVEAEVTVQPINTDGEDEGDPFAVPPTAVTVVTPAADEAEEDAEVSLIAAAGPLRPPAAWFENPKLEGPTALTITDEGRVYGHVATWGECHVGFSNTCVAPPTSPSAYKHFHVGEVVCDDGTRVAVGNLTLGGRHADVRLAYRSAIEHYDVSGSGVAVIRCYEDEFGIAFAGAVTPGTTEEQLYDMRRSPVSGDWRRVGGDLEMIGVLSVNSGGFNTPRFATDEAGRTALTAAPGVRPMSEEAIVAAAGGAKRGLSSDELVARVAAKVRADLAADQRAARLRGLAATVRPDPQRQRRKLDQLAAKLNGPQLAARRGRLAELAATVTR